MTSDEILSGAQAVQDIASALLKAAGDVMTVHGADPNSLAIVSAGFVMAITEIEKNIDPSFRKVVVAQLAGRS
jgi:hypothetical protein